MKHFSLFLFALLSYCSSTYAQQVCVTDDKSRQVCLEEPLKRIISLSPGSTELIYASGAGSRVIAADDHSDYPPEVKSVEHIGGFPNINIEAIAALKPDAVIAWAGGNNPKATAKLESIGIRVFYIDPISFKDISSVLRRLGLFFGTEKVANKAADDVDKRYQSIKLQYQPQKPVTVFYEVWSKPLMTTSRELIIGQVIEVCGGKNIFADAVGRVPKVSMESLLGMNPEVIVSSDNLKDGKTIEQRWAKWKNLKAVKEGHLFTINGNLISRPTPRALDAAVILCQQLESVRKESLVKASKTLKNTHKE
ncbi:cobalamin-binding protein [Endozoicomonas numazuensis]|uniref:cobalamin-binding protein n=1 Tax=Endozoicomonas numazuensis TaxID=1137799 RepID=UPI000691B80D|nr:cobalamin-binding protein [Endozoicomonas numazuensis]